MYNDTHRKRRFCSSYCAQDQRKCFLQPLVMTSSDLRPTDGTSAVAETASSPLFSPLFHVQRSSFPHSCIGGVQRNCNLVITMFKLNVNNKNYNSDDGNFHAARGCNYFSDRNQAARERKSSMLLKPSTFQVLTAPT